MNFTLLCVGRLKERFWREAADEYLKRLGRYGKVQEIETPDLPEPRHPSPALEKALLAQEGERLLKALRPEDQVIALAIDGEAMDSPAFSRFLIEQGRTARGRLVLVIGGSLGLDEAVLRRANARISLSAMTFPHQLARVLLLEQVYRGIKIDRGERYHK